MNQTNRLICVLGMHRSGTSVLTRLLNLLGVYLGKEEDLFSADQNNLDGYWENRYVVEIHDQILRHFDSSWHSPIIFPENWTKESEIILLKKRLIEIVQEGFDKSSLWGFKDPRTCLIIPLWKEISHDLGCELEFIHAIRNPLEVAASLTSRDGFTQSKGLGLWYHYTIQALYHTLNYSYNVVQYDKLIVDPANLIIELNKSMNLVNNISNNSLELIESSVKPKLKHHHLKSGDIQNYSDRVYLFYKEISESQSIDVELKNKIIMSFDGLSTYSAASTHVEKNNTIQLFYTSTDEFTEEMSIRSVIHRFNTVQDFEFIFNSDNGKITKLRLDPIDTVAVLEINSMNITCFDSDNNQDCIISYPDSKISHFTNNLLEIKNDDCLKFISLTDDPRIYFDINTDIYKIIKVNISIKIINVVDGKAIQNMDCEVRKLVKKNNEILDDLKTLINMTLSIKKQNDVHIQSIVFLTSLIKDIIKITGNSMVGLEDILLKVELIENTSKSLHSSSVNNLMKYTEVLRRNNIID